MRVTREQAAENHDRIVEAAARLFRERGFEGIGVAELMKEAGLTHGGFYGHFASKEDLMAEACERALEVSMERWTRRVASDPRDPLGALARGYLSARHRDEPGAGCLLAALGPDAARHGPGVRRAITTWLDPALDFLARHVPGRSKAARRRRAIATLSGWVGAMVLARAVDDAALSGEILEAALECTTAS
jgi:TetR/AcrR family transcriptional repressor of nem operon